MHVFPGTKKAVFLNKENILCMASVENSETGEETKLTEVLYNKQPWQMITTWKHDAPKVVITGTKQEASAEVWDRKPSPCRHAATTLFDGPASLVSVLHPVSSLLSITLVRMSCDGCYESFVIIPDFQ